MIYYTIICVLSTIFLKMFLYRIIIYTLFDDKTIESCVYYNNLGETLNSFDEVFDDDLIAITGLCRIVEAAAIENLSEYFSKSSQEKISNRIYEKTGVRI